MVLAKFTAEQNLKSIMKAPFDDVLQGAVDAMKIIMGAFGSGWIKINQSIRYKRKLENAEARSS